MTSAGFCEPVVLSVSTGAVAPLFTNCSAFPLIVSVAIGVAAGPTALKVRALSWKLPTISLLEKIVADDGKVPLNTSVVSKALTGAVPPLQFKPVLH